ncbi:hypothetical protein RZE82_02925 [Mollicutes bacterium LVI A0039]|nr:hypothetical protein RZE82_02925 [Mollicutes bacterium LVI A0039]
MKKILLSLLLLTLTGCSTAVVPAVDTAVITTATETEESSFKDLIFESDLIVKVEPLEDLSSKNSVITYNADGTATEFYNQRPYKVVEVLNGETSTEEIQIKEAVAYDGDNDVLIEAIEGAADLTMKSGHTYLLYLDQDGDSYTIKADGKARIDYNTDPLNVEFSYNNTLLEEISKKDALKENANTPFPASMKNITLGSSSIDYFDKYVIIDGSEYIITSME